MRRSCLEPHLRRGYNLVIAVLEGPLCALSHHLLGFLEIQNVPLHHSASSVLPISCYLSRRPHVTFLITLIRIKEVDSSFHQSQFSEKKESS